MTNEAELTYLIFLIALLIVVHLILSHSGSRPHNENL